MNQNPEPSSGGESGRTLETARRIETPRGEVYAAFSDPERLARWWGPNGFTNAFEEFDLRPGGAWRFTMQGPDGTRYPNESIFLEVAAPERVVIRHISAPRFDLTITLTEEGDGTLVGWRQLFETEEVCRRIAKIAGEANEQNLDRLAAEVLRTP